MNKDMETLSRRMPRCCARDARAPGRTASGLAVMLRELEQEDVAAVLEYARHNPIDLARHWPLNQRRGTGMAMNGLASRSLAIASRVSVLMLLALGTNVMAMAPAPSAPGAPSAQPPGAFAPPQAAAPAPPLAAKTARKAGTSRSILRLTPVGVQDPESDAHTSNPATRTSPRR
jgi:hypothetical protein